MAGAEEAIGTAPCDAANLGRGRKEPESKEWIRERGRGSDGGEDGEGRETKKGTGAISFDAFKTRSSSRIRIKKLTLEETLSAALTDCER